MLPLPLWVPSTADITTALVALSGFHFASFALYALLPASRVTGYTLEPRKKAKADGGVFELSSYPLPAFALLLVGLVAWAAAVRANVTPAAELWARFPAICVSSTAVGLLASVAFFLRGVLLRRTPGAIDERARCPTVDSFPAAKKGDGLIHAPPATAAETAEFRGRSIVEHFYCGLSEYNPKLLGVDVKMWLYATGAVLLQLNLLSQLAADAAVGGGPVLGASLAGTTVTGLLTFFIAEYMWQERVHLWTYDIIRERIGFKLLFGCLTFYPCFYSVPMVAVVAQRGAQPKADISPAAAAACVALFFAGWLLTRGANLQKHHVKTRGADAPFMWGLVKCETVPGSGGRVLCSGFWGVSRHVNYCGEIVQALALALPALLAGGSLWGLLYPLYYVGLFIPRQQDDDAVCEAKYGPKVWGEYCKRVPYRIVPGIY